MDEREPYSILKGASEQMGWGIVSLFLLVGVSLCLAARWACRRSALEGGRKVEGKAGAGAPLTQKPRGHPKSYQW